MSVKDLLSMSRDMVKLVNAKVSIATVTTTSFDFGTPDDINLAALAGYRPGDRIVVVFTNTTVGTTDTTGWVIQDAPDNAGAIGAPAAAVVDGDLTGGTGDRVAMIAVKVQPGRPWLRIRTTRAAGTTDTTVVTAAVFAVRRSRV